jgi:hypothetical protein
VINSRVVVAPHHAMCSLAHMNAMADAAACYKCGISVQLLVARRLQSYRAARIAWPGVVFHL